MTISMVGCTTGCSDSKRSIGQGTYGACVMVGIFNLIIESGCLLEYLRTVNKPAYDALVAMDLPRDSVGETPADVEHDDFFRYNESEFLEGACPKLPAAVWRVYDSLSKRGGARSSDSWVGDLTPESEPVTMTASEVFDERLPSGVDAVLMLRAIFLDKINVANAQESNVVMRNKGDVVVTNFSLEGGVGGDDTPFPFRSSSVYNPEYPLVVIEGQKVDYKLLNVLPMQGIGAGSVYAVVNLGEFDVLQVSPEFREYVTTSRNTAEKIANGFYPQDTRVGVAHHFLIDVFHIEKIGRHVVSGRLCDTTGAVDICSYGRCRLDLHARAEFMQSIDDDQEKQEYTRELIDLAKRADVKKHPQIEQIAQNMAANYKPIFIGHVFMPIS